MNKKLLLIFLSLSALCNAKTDYPEWMNAERRESLFPSTAYYSGFAVAEMGRDETMEDAVERAKQGAFGNLMSKISVIVQHHASDTLKDVVENDRAYSQSIYSSVTILSTRMAEIPGIEVKTFVNKQSGIAAVMAYVPKAGLSQKLQRQLIAQMTRVNIRIEDAENFINAGNKTMANDAVTNARMALGMADDTRRTLIAIDPVVSSEQLLDDEWRVAEMKIIALESELNRSVKVCLRCTLDGSEDNSLTRMLSGELYKNGCILADPVEQAEWNIEISASTAPYNKVEMGDYLFFFSYATATLKISGPDGKQYYSDEMKSKGCHTKDYDYASAAALQQLSAELGKSINDVIRK